MEKLEDSSRVDFRDNQVLNLSIQFTPNMIQKYWPEIPEY